MTRRVPSHSELERYAPTPDFGADLVDREGPPPTVEYLEVLIDHVSLKLETQNFRVSRVERNIALLQHRLEIMTQVLKDVASPFDLVEAFHNAILGRPATDREVREWTDHLADGLALEDMIDHLTAARNSILHDNTLVADGDHY